MGITYLAHTSTSPMPPASNRINFSIGQPVEVSNKPQGSYYEATVISRLHHGFYVIEYNTLLNDDDNNNFLTETVYPSDLRPLPPPIVVSPTGFSLHQTVDAYKNEGWWVTTITERRGSDFYIAYSKTTDQDVEFHCSELRLHQEWINGQWILS